jgi:DNA-binding transcriptional regulator YhcF (GntR family)
MTSVIRVDPADPTPTYEQVRRQIADAIGFGALRPGTQLPTVRQLAGDLGVATGTVMRAYSELESAHLVRTARGAGTVVASVPTPPPVDQSERLDALTHGFIASVRLLGATDSQITDAVQRGLAPDTPEGPQA